MRKLFLLITVALLLSVNCAKVVADDPVAVAKPSENKIMPSPTPIPVLAWSGLPMSLSTVERFKELREAGFTHHFQVYGSIEDMKKVLTAAQQADVKIFLNVIDSKEMPLKEFIAEITKYPALTGYFITDEPSDTKTYEQWGEIVKSIQALDSEHWCYINLLPTYGMPYIKGARDYKDYVDTFLKKVPVKVLTFDHYPVVPDGKGGVGIREDFYENLEIIRHSALKAKLPFWAFVLSTSHSGYPVPTMAHLRYQIYSDMAYGAQGIQYFTYWTVTMPGMDFNTGPLDQHGKRTVVYDLAKAMNKELQALSGIFKDSKVISVTHTGKKIPKKTKLYRVKTPFRRFFTKGEGVVVSEIEKGNRRFLVMVNRDIEKPTTLTVTPDGSTKMFEIAKDGTISPISEETSEFQIAPGDIKILMWPVSQAQ